MASRTRRFAAVAGATLVALALTTACTPAPAPTPTPTGFASEEEAFAAAEATYRAYVDALNQVAFDDPASFDAVFAWTTSAANAADRKDFSRYHADNMTLEGEFAVSAFQPDSWDQSTSEVGADACLDVSGTQIVDANGVSTVSPDRAAIVAVRVELVNAPTSTGMIIEDVTARDDGLPC